MSVLSRLRAGAKAFSMTFTGNQSGLWSAFVGRTRYDYAREVGDGTRNSIVVACLGWIARNFPEAPLRVRQKDDTGEWTTTEDAGALRMVDLLRRPNSYFSGILLWMATITDFWIHGNALWVKVRTSDKGPIAELWWIPWHLVTPRWSTDGTEFVGWYEYAVDGGRRIRIEAADVVHFRYGVDPDNIRVGKSPLTSIIREVFTDDEAANFSASLLRNLGVPGVIITPADDEGGIGQSEADAIKAKFRDSFGGDNRGEPLVMSGKVGVQVLSFSPQQMDLKALRRVPEERITAVLGVPAIVAGLGAGLDRSTFSNVAEARMAGWEENLLPSQRILASQIDVQLLPEFVLHPADFLVDFDVTEVRALQDDQNLLWARAADAASKGLITIASFKQQVGLPVNEDSDRIYLRGFNIVVVPEDQPAPEIEPGTPPAPEVPPVPSGSSGEPVATPDAGSGNADMANLVDVIAGA